MSRFIISVKSPAGSWATGAGVGTIVPDLGFSYSDKLSEMNIANINISGTGEVKRALIGIGSEIKIQKGGTLDFHGTVQSIDYFEGGSLSLNVWGYELWLGRENGAYAGSPWSSTASATIFNAVLGDSNYFTAGTVEAGTSVDYRAEVTDSIWNVIGDLTNSTSQDIGIDYPNLEIDILDHKGSSTSVKTYNAGIQIGDVRITQNYPKANKVLVYGKSEGETRIVSDYPTHGRDATSQSNYGTITYIVRDPKITTQAQADLLADAEVARLKDPIKIYDFDIFNPNQNIVSGDVITINALSQGVDNEDVRIVAIERGVKRDEEFLTVQVVNEAYSRLTKTSENVMAQIDKNFRDQQTYDGYADEYSNRSINTTIAGVIDVGTGSGSVGFAPISTNTDFWFMTGGSGDIYLSPGTSGQVLITGLVGVHMGNNKIVSMEDPASAQDAATKAYVDASVGEVWSCPGSAFGAVSPDFTDVHIHEGADGYIQLDSGLGDYFFAPIVGLPHGATVTAVIVYGNAGLSDENWFLRRIDISAGTGDTMASTACNSEDTTITNPTIDNNNYAYHIGLTLISVNDRIYGARIKYTI